MKKVLFFTALFVFLFIEACKNNQNENLQKDCENEISQEKIDSLKKVQLDCFDGHINGGYEYTNEEIQSFTKQAEKGNAIAQYNLGLCYYYGCGVIISYDEAFKWFKKSADQGDSFGIVKLAELYDNGDGVIKDQKRAFELYMKAAKMGDLTGIGRVASCYEYGNDVIKENKSEAKKYYKLQYDKCMQLIQENKGNADIYHTLGICYENGQGGVEINKNEANKWYKKKIEDLEKYASIGDSSAMDELGDDYYYGFSGLEKNEQKGLDYYTKAAEQGYVWSQLSLGIHYSRKNRELSQKWYRKAWEQGYHGLSISF